MYNEERETARERERESEREREAERDSEREVHTHGEVHVKTHSSTHTHTHTHTHMLHSRPLPLATLSGYNCHRNKQLENVLFSPSLSSSLVNAFLTEKGKNKKCGVIKEKCNSSVDGRRQASSPSPAHGSGNKRNDYGGGKGEGT